MKLNTAAVVATISILASTFGVISLNQVNAANPASKIAQASSQPSDQPPEGQRPPRPDFAAAAQKLGVSEQKLKEALGVPANPPSQGQGQRPPRPDFAAAAQKLGVSEQKLKEALGVPANPPGQGQGQRQGKGQGQGQGQGDFNQRPPRPDFAAAAQKLGVSEQKLKEALGVPANPPSEGQGQGQRPPRPDFAAAAQKLGVSEQKLKEALGVPANPPEENRSETRR
ncbi:hypothetical protein [Nostoc sp. FACHB-190]|uniref:hypothetical protein n=1 Tax=Nostoc sp. FACHB-190 TaxID=2692838 RepID=UPI0016844667|nr:hypothetical protein [Nostoc sp. FACHB-190]MBD2298992.1 hypothetical protein [Nostoc sp. FACHB-190]